MRVVVRLPVWCGAASARVCEMAAPASTLRGLNEHTNFERFWTAALTLFKVATNDNWTDIMIACFIQVRVL